METIFKALAEKSRLRILALLLNGEMCVCHICLILNMTQSNVSRHLAVLRSCGIIDSSKSAQWVYYRISDRFKMEQPLLWGYLKETMPKTTCFLLDYENFLKYKDCDLCS